MWSIFLRIASGDILCVVPSLKCLNDLFRSNGIGSFTMTVTYFVKIVFTVEERYRNSEFKVMETIYRNIIRSAMECNSGKSMSMIYEPMPDLDRFEFELHFEK